MARQSFDQWVDDGRKTIGERIREKIRHILENHQVPQLDDSVLMELDRLKKKGEAELS